MTGLLASVTAVLALLLATVLVLGYGWIRTLQGDLRRQVGQLVELSGRAARAETLRETAVQRLEDAHEELLRWAEWADAQEVQGTADPQPDPVEVAQPYPGGGDDLPPDPPAEATPAFDAVAGLMPDAEELLAEMRDPEPEPAPDPETVTVLVTPPTQPERDGDQGGDDDPPAPSPPDRQMAAAATMVGGGARRHPLSGTPATGGHGVYPSPLLARDVRWQAMGMAAVVRARRLAARGREQVTGWWADNVSVARAPMWSAAWIPGHPVRRHDGSGTVWAVA